MSETNELFRAINAACAGHSESAVLQALLNCLVTAIGVTSPGLGRAEALIDALPGELKPLLRKNWQGYRRHRARAAKRSARP